MNYPALRTRNHCIPEADESWIVHKNAKKNAGIAGAAK